MSMSINANLRTKFEVSSFNHSVVPKLQKWIAWPHGIPFDLILLFVCAPRDRYAWQVWSFYSFNHFRDMEGISKL